jgi:hypothetical protein
VDNDGLEDLIAEYFALLNDSNGTEEDSLVRLADVLDRLSLAARHVDYTLEDHQPDPPADDYLLQMERLRSLARRRFPGFESYNLASPVTGSPSDARIIGCDPYDDVAEVGQALSTVQWALDRTSVNDALSRFSSSYLAHWGAHAHNLRWYLFTRVRNASKVIF